MEQNKQKKQKKEDKTVPIRSDQNSASKPLATFFSAIENDCRISTTHLGIFVALLQFSTQSGFINPIMAFSYQIMPMAKILASNTYHKHVKELSAYGYIRYEPSFKKNKPSCIYLLMD